jgi:hypothetical protein
MSCPRCTVSLSSSAAFFSSYSPMCLRLVWTLSYILLDIPLTAGLVPLATLVSATRRPSTKENAILSPDGFKRYFVTHGGLFSKDGITLDEIRKIQRIGRQPGTEGLMCTCLLILTTWRAIQLTYIYRRGSRFQPSLLEVEC